MSKKDVASFKLRKGMPIGVKVTLRADKMYEFLDRLVSASLPRIRDFNGINPNGFDGRGNYNMGGYRADNFPRDQHRPDKQDIGYGHHLCYIGQDR